MANYPSVKLIVGDRIWIVDPCLEPELQATSQMELEPYSYKGVSPNVEFIMNPFDVVPSMCLVTYTCEMIQSSPVDEQLTDNDLPFDFRLLGDYFSPVNFDICSVKDEYTEADFSAMTGNYIFWSQDMTTYPPGTYSVKITGRSGEKSDFIVLEIVLVDPCLTAVIELETSPFSDQKYMLTDPQIE